MADPKRRKRIRRRPREVPKEPTAEEIVDEIEEESEDEEYEEITQEEIPNKEPNELDADDEPDDEDEQSEPAPAGTVTFKNDPFVDMIQAIVEQGKSITIVPADGGFSMSLAEGVVTAKTRKKMTNKEFAEEVLDPAYVEWNDTWKTLSSEEKIKKAKELGVEWEEHATERINIMRVTEAVRTHQGIKKYKKEYRDRKARAALR